MFLASVFDSLVKFVRTACVDCVETFVARLLGIVGICMTESQMPAKGAACFVISVTHDTYPTHYIKYSKDDPDTNESKYFQII